MSNEHPPLFLQLTRSSSPTLGPCYYDQIHARRQLIFVPPKYLPDTTFHRVSPHRVSHLSAGGDTEPTGCRLVFFREECQMWGDETRSTALHIEKIPPLPDALGPRQFLIPLVRGYRTQIPLKAPVYFLKTRTAIRHRPRRRRRFSTPRPLRVPILFLNP